MPVTPDQSGSTATGGVRLPAHLFVPARAAFDREPGIDPTIERARACVSRVAEPPAREVVEFAEQVGPVEPAARFASGDVPADAQDLTAVRPTVNRVDAHRAAAVGARVLSAVKYAAMGT